MKTRTTSIHPPEIVIRLYVYAYVHVWLRACMRMNVLSGVENVLNKCEIFVNSSAKYSFHSITSNSNDASGICAWHGLKYSTSVALLMIYRQALLLYCLETQLSLAQLRWLGWTNCWKTSMHSMLMPCNKGNRFKRKETPNHIKFEYRANFLELKVLFPVNFRRFIEIILECQNQIWSNCYFDVIQLNLQTTLITFQWWEIH